MYNELLVLDLQKLGVKSRPGPLPHPGLNSTVARYCLLWALITPSRLNGKHSPHSYPSNAPLYKSTENKSSSVQNMETKISRKRRKIFEPSLSKIEAGGSYEIMDFHVNRMRGQYRVVLYDTQVVFTGKTTFKKLTSVFPPIPRHRFYLQDYNRPYPRLNRVYILTDIMGRITAVQHLERTQEKRVESHVMSKCCRNFFFFISSSIQPTGHDCFDKFESKVAIKKLPPSSKQANKAEVLQAAKKVTIEELAFLDPDLHKDDTFLCKASVKRFDTRYDWWYSTCPNCAKQMQKDLTIGQLVCQKHGSQIPTAS
ncbi:hypothetical protein DVH24_019843 [Malus domestica]|uniref:Replication factor A C-terminal domain-containing protein n=1 Tax=Malus domestica TaxID=3750 RepID=A0A498I4E0_MALDO|nr:hypothetical protein DVH24_019843 [Malus domestica]